MDQRHDPKPPVSSERLINYRYLGVHKGYIDLAILYRKHNNNLGLEALVRRVEGEDMAT